MKKLITLLVLLLILVSGTTSVGGIPGLVVHYKMDDNATNSAVIDAVGAHNGILRATSDSNTSAHTATGKINSALDFDGSSDHVEIADHADFDFTDALSISGWIKLDTVGADSVIVASDDGSNRNFAVYIDANKKIDFYKFTSNAATVLVSNTPMDTATWYHIVVTYSAETISKANFDTYKHLAGRGVSNPVIDDGANGESDDNIREIGNVLYEPNDDTEKYKIFYTGYDIGTGYGTGPAYDEKVHYAYSTDGATWTKGGANPVIAGRAEDPYVVKNGSTYYLFAEDKAGGGTEIKQWSLTDCNSDCNSWSDNGVVFSPAGSGWDSWGVSSPVVWIEDGTWYLLYEGSDTSFAVAEIGLATSDDGITWTRSASNPVFIPSDSWGVESVAPDDITKVGGVYYLIYHGDDSNDVYHTLQATSNNLTDWSDHIGNKIYDDAGDSRGAQVIYDGSEYVFYYSGTDDTYGIYKGYPYPGYGNMIIYLNEVVDSSSVVALDDIDTDNVNLTMAARTGNDRNLNGLIDDVMVFNIALTPAQVGLLYKSDGRYGSTAGRNYRRSRY